MKIAMYGLTVVLLSACTGTARIDTPPIPTVNVEYEKAQPNFSQTTTPTYQQPYYPESMWQAPPRQYRSNYQLLGNYVSRMASELVRNLSPSFFVKPIGVVSFVNLDSTLQTTNLAGNQIAEEFITEIRQLGLPVVDYKLTGDIRVTESGDFVFSRNAGELKQKIGINNVLTGTLIWHEGGLIINARIIDLETNAVLAAGKGYIPYFVADQIFSGPNNKRFYGYSEH